MNVLLVSVYDLTAQLKEMRSIVLGSEQPNALKIPPTMTNTPKPDASPKIKSLKLIETLLPKTGSRLDAALHKS